MHCADGAQYNETERCVLLNLARQSISHGLQHGELMPWQIENFPESLRAIRASFVTLTVNGQLRGCIGSLEAFRPLALDVLINAAASAFRDPRFRPVGRDELPGIDIHISVLSTPTPIEFADEADLLPRLRPGTDGLIIRLGERRATFLPIVWSSLPEPRMFLTELKRKAGISDGENTCALEAWRYTTESFSESGRAR